MSDMNKIFEAIKEAAKTDRQKSFERDFETCDKTGAYLFTTDACMRRYSKPRREIDLTDAENKRFDLTTRKVGFEESILQSEYASTNDISVFDETSIQEPEYWDD